jgi:hypothetical protein
VHHTLPFVEGFGVMGALLVGPGVAQKIVASVLLVLPLLWVATRNGRKGRPLLSLIAALWVAWSSVVLLGACGVDVAAHASPWFRGAAETFAYSFREMVAATLRSFGL